MLTKYSMTVNCASCKEELYPHESYKCRYLCGDELCPPTPKLHKFLDCRMRYFCSETCYEKYENSPRKCNITRWNHFLQQVINAAQPLNLHIH